VDDAGLTKCSEIPPYVYHGQRCNLSATTVPSHDAATSGFTKVASSDFESPRLDKFINISVTTIPLFHSSSSWTNNGDAATDDFAGVTNRTTQGTRASQRSDLSEQQSHTGGCINWNQYYTTCRPAGSNPFHGAISFDNIGLAWVAIFQVCWRVQVSLNKTLLILTLRLWSIELYIRYMILIYFANTLW
jgi:hypothetical protein